MIEDNETVPILLIGGPMDGYDDISTNNLREIVNPGPHHREAAGCLVYPWYYRILRGRYLFGGLYEST